MVVDGIFSVIVGVALLTVKVNVFISEAYAPAAAWVAVTVVVPEPVKVTVLPLMVATAGALLA